MNAEIIQTLEDAYPGYISFSNFLDEWLEPITKSANLEEAVSLIAEANSKAHSMRTPYRVEIVEEDGRFSLNFHYDEVSAPLTVRLRPQSD